MIRANFNTYNSYVTDSLYQWDLNQDLVINGLNLPTAPEIHFSNANMERAIVRHSTLESGVVTVRIPNSLLQSAPPIKVYVGIYEGETFKVIEKIEIPVIARERPSDYRIEDTDEEIYSFNELNTKIDEAREIYINSSTPPYIGANNNWYIYDTNLKRYVDSGVLALGDSELLKVLTINSNGFERPLPAYTELRFNQPVDWLTISDFERNAKHADNNLWAIQFTAGENISVSFPIEVVWAVAEPVFTPGYTYYLSFLPFGYKILGIWVAKELG
jgi:hypothetical protein